MVTGDLRLQIGVLLRIGVVERGPQNRDRSAPAGDSRPVCSSIDARGEATDNHNALLCQRASESIAAVEAGLRSLA